MSFLDTIKFSELTSVFERGSNQKLKATVRKNTFSQFFEQLLKFQKKYKSNHPNQDSSLYPLIRLMFANDEHERSYNMQEFRIRKLLIKTLQLVPGTPHHHQIEKCNDDDLADTAYEVVNSRSGSKVGSLSVSEVDKALNLMAGDASTQFLILYNKSSAINIKWIIKIILKNMKLKIADKTILDNYHPLANGLFERYQHLSKVCELIENGDAEKALNEIKPFLPIRAMLSQKVTSDTNKNFLSYGEFYAETKMDGERFQLHMENDEYRYYSRNAHDYSEGFNKLITPHLKFHSVVHSLVLDGEMLVWSKKDNRYVTKGEKNDVDVKRIFHENGRYQPCFCPFNVLYLNGVGYIDRPYADRAKILENLIIDHEGIIKRVESTKVRDTEHIAQLLNIAMSNHEEGIILKKASSKYEPGERNKGWYKVKPDYLDDNVVLNFDVIIIGGYYQNEHTQDFIQKYLLGAIRKNDDGTFDVFAIGEAVHGLSVQKRLELSQTLKVFGSPFKNDASSEVPFEKGTVFFGKSKPHIFIPPHKSKILEIRTSELALSSDFYTAYTFRFPRIQYIRIDKIWDEACTLSEFEDLYKNANGKVVKINQRNVHKDDVLSPPKKRARARHTIKDAIFKFCGDPQLEVTSIDNALKGREFCVMGTSMGGPSEQDLKVLLKLHGAFLTAIPRKNKTFAIIAGDLTKRSIRDYTTKPKAEDNINVIKAEWVANNFDCELVISNFPKIVPRDFLFMSENLKQKFDTKFDKYGDSYTEPIKDTNELMTIINEMEVTTPPTLVQSQIFDAELYDETLPNPNFFRGLVGIFIHSKEHKKTPQLSIAENIFKFRAGKVVNENQMEADNAIIFADKMQAAEQQDFINREVINFRYIFDSNRAGKKLDMKTYKL